MCRSPQRPETGDIVDCECYVGAGNQTCVFKPVKE